MRSSASFLSASEEDCFEHADYLAMAILYSRIVETAILRLGITPTQYRILTRLSSNRKGWRIGHLAELLDLGASAVTGAVAQMEDAGIAIRIDSARDRRGVYVLATERGMHLIHTADAALRPLLEDIRDDFPSSLRKYVSLCTLRVADQNGLFIGKEANANVNAALCDEILLTSMLVNHVMRDEGLGITAYRALLTLKDFPSGIRPGALSQLLDVKPNALAAAQSDLLSRNLITRTRDEYDRRAVLIDMTSDGYQVLRSCSIAMKNALYTRILPDLTESDVVKHNALAVEVLKIRCVNGELRLCSQVEALQA